MLRAKITLFASRLHLLRSATSAGEFAQLYNMSALKIAQRGQRPKITEFRKQRLAEKFVNRISIIQWHYILKCNYLQVF